MKSALLFSILPTALAFSALPEGNVLSSTRVSATAIHPSIHPAVELLLVGGNEDRLFCSRFSHGSSPCVLLSRLLPIIALAVAILLLLRLMST